MYNHMLFIIYLVTCVILISLSLYQILDRRNLRLYIKPSLEQFYDEILSLLDQQNITYFLDYGTLLGYYRNQKLIDYEFDVDVGIHADQSNKVIEVLKKKLPEDYYIRTPKKGDFSIWKKTNIKVKHRRRLGSLDIYIYYPFDYNTLCQAQACQFDGQKLIKCQPIGSEYSQLPSDWFFPLKETEIMISGRKKKCYVPNQYGAYLSHLYGSKDAPPNMTEIWKNKLFIKRFWAKS